MEVEEVRAYLVADGVPDGADTSIDAFLDRIATLETFAPSGSVPKEFEANAAC